MNVNCPPLLRTALTAILFLTLNQWAQAQSSTDVFSRDLNAPAAFSAGVKGSYGSDFEETEFLKVDQAYILNVQLEPEGDKTPQLRVNWQIAEGYYLYRHSFKFSLRDREGNPVDFETHIPSGLAKVDEYFGNVEVYYHNLDIELRNIVLQGDTSPAATAELTLSVTSQGCADAGLCYPPQTRYFRVDADSNSAIAIDKSETGLSTTTQIKPSASEKASLSNDLSSLPYMLLLALLGGVILNLMPCVFPVLSLKVLAFANDKEHSQAVHGVTYSIGVVVSFVAVAAVLVSLQAAGEAVGWGFHLQSSWFVAALAYLFFVLGLSLSGMVEIGTQWMNFGNKFAGQSGYSGSFFTGVLAAVVASPCTAPMMGTALGFAVTQPPLIAISIFAVLGLGMALPVLLLSFSPRLLNKIPKPGPWMDQLKQFLAFPLYATAVWLAWVVGKQSSVNGMAIILLGCVLITLAIWLWNTYRGNLVKAIGAACTVGALALLGSPLLSSDDKNTETQNWQPYSAQTLASLREQGTPVFINVTADWCITCLANERVALNSDKFKATLHDSGIIYLKGDWTNNDPRITELLRNHGRESIPLYVFFPANGDEAVILPQFLTTNILLEAFGSKT